MSVISGTTGAVMGANAQESAANTAASAQDRATQSQERIYQQQRADFEPYRNIGLAALPYLMSALTGQSYSAINPQYTPLTTEDVQKLNTNSTRYDPSRTWYQGPNGTIVSNPPGTSGSTAYNIVRPYLNTAPQAGYTPLSRDQVASLNGSHSTSQQWYRGPNGEIVSAADVPQSNVSFQPGQSPAAQYQLERGNTALMRSLGARGLAGSGGAAVKLADLSKSVAASDWQDQYNRLLDLVKVGTGASAATGGAASTLSNAYGQGAQNLGNIYNQAGQAKASLYSGMGNASANTFGTGLRAYQYGQSQGWWGGAGGAAASSYGSGAGLGGSSFTVAPTATEYGTYSLA